MSNLLGNRGSLLGTFQETAYWVNYDISVPLFLAPLYASDRLEVGHMGTNQSAHVRFVTGCRYIGCNASCSITACQRFTVIYPLVCLPPKSPEAPLLGQLNFESGWQWGYWLAASAPKEFKNIRSGTAALRHWQPSASGGQLGPGSGGLAKAHRRPGRGFQPALPLPAHCHASTSEGALSLC